MALCSRRPLHTPSARGFSLIELSIVVAIISVVATLGLEVAANFVNRTSTSVSRERLKVIDEATAAFFKVYGRLPCPAPIADAPTAATYGLENCSVSTNYPNGMAVANTGASLLAGGVAFRTLNLPAIYALDGFNSKFKYVVTTNLTRAGLNSSQFGNAASQPTIEIRTGVLAQPCNASNCQVLASTTGNDGAAYVILSHGSDQRGAHSARGVALKPCANPVANTDRRVDAQNCIFGDSTLRSYISVSGASSTIPYAVFYDNRTNTGFNLTSYFNDVVVWRPRSQL